MRLAVGWLSAALVLMGVPSSLCVDYHRTFRAAAVQRHITFGTAVSTEAFAGDPGYHALLGAQFSQVTPENALKWSNIEPTRGTFDFRDIDALVAFAQAHHQTVRGHTLVWHQRIPDWVRSLDSSGAEAALEAHVNTVVSRFRGKIGVWDVVNEPLEDDGSLRRSFWLSRLGPDYIATALRAARRADPSARLYLNEYGAEALNAKSDGLYDLVRSLRSRGVPLDGVGFQGHFAAGEVPQSLQYNLSRFADLGLDVAITELDVRVRTPAKAGDVARQAVDYAHVIRACLLVPRCTEVSVWGFTDQYSWVPKALPGWGDALLWDRRYGDKPARRSVLLALEG